MPATLDPAATYRQEAAELLVQLEETLLDLEGSPDDHGLIDKAFRALHTIKGSGSMFGFDAVARFTHHIETAFEAVRSGTRPVTPALVSLTLGSLDHIRGLIDGPDEEAADARGRHLLARLAEIMAAPPAADPPPGGGGPAAANDPGEATWRISLKLAQNVLAFGTNPVLLLNELRAMGECSITALTDDIPELDALDPTGCYLAWDILLTTRQPRTAIEDVFIFVSDSAALDIQVVPVAGGEPKKLGEILVERRDVAPETVDAALKKQEKLGDILVRDGKVAPGKVTSALAEQQHLRDKAKPSEVASVRVQAERLDALMDQVGELVITQARLHQIAAVGGDLALRSIAEEVERLVADLRDTTMGIRMLPIGTLFGRFRRVVRDLSQSLGKDVTLTVDGEETELDKTVIENLNDPLIHLIRNAMGHGIEDSTTRLKAGKPAVGRVHLSALHSGAQVLITIADDGAGMNREAIRAKAEERGLLKPGEEVTDQQLYSFIFHPGFSTATHVSSVSGRGVGMDVVRQAIESLRGSIDVQSTPGAGSRITLKLPLTLAIIDGLLVEVRGGRYVLPLAAVEEVVDLTPEEDTRSTGRSFLNLRGDLVPFVRLRDLFGSAGRPGRYQKVVIVSFTGKRVGLVVDHVIGQYQTVIRSLSRLLDDVEQFSGATILGDGSVALIIDIPHLIDCAQARDAALRAS